MRDGGRRPCIMAAVTQHDTAASVGERVQQRAAFASGRSTRDAAQGLVVRLDE